MQCPVLVLSLIKLTANVHRGRQQMMAQTLRSLPPTWEMQVEFQATGFHLAQPWLEGL